MPSGRYPPYRLCPRASGSGKLGFAGSGSPARRGAGSVRGGFNPRRCPPVALGRGRNGSARAEFRFACQPVERGLVSGNAIDEVKPVAAEDDIDKKVKAACRDLIDAATGLRKAPLEAGLFDQVSSSAKSVESLREAALKALESANAEVLIERLVRFFKERVEGTPSLTERANEIRELWKAVYLMDETSLAYAEAQARQQLGESFGAWDDARSACEKAAIRLSASQEKLAAAPADIEAEMETTKCKYEHLSALKEIRDAEESILAAMSPPGHEANF